MSLSGIARWLYRGKRPNWIARIANRIWAVAGSLGAAPGYLAALEVAGRASGRPFSLPVVIAIVKGQRYLVSMLGENVSWVRNVRAAEGKAVLVSGAREEIVLVDVPVEARAPILKAYLQRAPGARPHISVDKDAPIEEFERLAPQHPVFRVTSRNSG